MELGMTTPAELVKPAAVWQYAEKLGMLFFCEDGQHLWHANLLSRSSCFEATVFFKTTGTRSRSSGLIEPN
jgi:hypothetical protein